MAKSDYTGCAVILVYLFWMLVTLAFWAGLIWAGIHFARKFW